MAVSKGTTPTFTLTFTDEDLDLTQAAHVYVSFKGLSGNVEKSDTDLDVDEKTISVYLSQEETLSLCDGNIGGQGNVQVQANWTYPDGKRAASTIVSFPMTDNLIGRVLE